MKHIYDYRIKEFYNFENIKELYNINNGDFLKYYTLLGNIKTEWKQAMLSEQINNDIPKYLISTILTSKHVNKTLYDKEINNMRLPQQKHILKWENELNNENNRMGLYFLIAIQKYNKYKT